MSKAILLDAGMKQRGEVALPERYAQINPHNLYLYVKSYLAGTRSNSAHAKSRGEVSGGGKKPWAQKGGGRARAGSITSPVFVGGGVAHGPSNNRNYEQKINKKQKRLALECALQQKADGGKLFVVEKISVESGKTKDAATLIKALNAKNVLVIKEEVDEKIFMAFRNLPNCYLARPNEINGYLVGVFGAVLCEQAVLDKIINEG